MPNTNSFADLRFNPSISELVPSGVHGTINVFTGRNNSGKSAYLKQAIDQAGKLYIGINRFYSFHHLGFYNKDDNEVANLFNNMQGNKYQPFNNFEGSFFNPSSAIVRLNNDRRAVLFDTFGRLFGQKVEVRPEDPENEFSPKFISINGDSLSVTSSGTRLFLGILSAIMDERFSMVAIDEPELGLSPPLQRSLADIILRKKFNDELFPHNPNIIISTHSHLFLDKDNPNNNWVVTKLDNNIEARRCADFGELHDIQLRLLGNDLGELFFPHAVLFVEGETDKLFLEKVIRLRFPSLRVVVQDCGGDIAKRLSYWEQSLGDMQVSPYRRRTFAVFDKVVQPGLERICDRLGLPEENKIKWNGNGIEYVYPVSGLRRVYRSGDIEADALNIDGDHVAFGPISYKKMELCQRICAELTADSVYPTELEQKLLEVIGGLQA